VATIPGASRFLNAATLAAKNGTPARADDLLSRFSGSASLLNVGRNNSVPGIGLSASSRALTQDLLNKSSQSANGLFSATVGAAATVEGLQTQILAIRSGLSIDQVAPSLRGDNVDTEA
jgi:hypothetical protein